MPKYWRNVEVAAADVRRIRAAAKLTQGELALELALAARTIERWERDGATLERVSSLSTAYHATRYGRLEAVARRGGLELELVDLSDSLRRAGDAIARLRKPRPRTRHFSLDLKKRPRKTRQAPRSAPHPRRRVGR
jgi:transcriptional regulator with XRE-family HTH domain